ncbi:MAG TPA: LysR family transcriptional regulator [Candidatus Aquilonibacter sp.]|nr:LysR family transcriptional regulator [Candidatus Aquilonibacter sp.]
MNEIDLRLMRAAVAVAEELSFSRAAIWLHISQPALTKQIQDLEGFLKTKLFERGHQKVTLTDAGRAFVAEAQLCLLHHHRAIQGAKSAAKGAEAILNIGHSPYTDPLLTSIISSVHLPLYPNLRLHVSSDYSPELSRRVVAGEIDVAVLAVGDESPQLVSIELARSPLYILVEQGSELSYRRELTLADLTDVPWILFAQQVHPILYDAIAKRAVELGIEPSERHHVTSAEHAAQLVKSTGGVAFLTKRGAWRVAVAELTIRPLSEAGLEVNTVLVARKDAGRLVGEFLRAVVRKIKQISEPAQRDLPLAV